MFDAILLDDTRHDLALLNASGCLSNFYLGGGTAVALHLGHRRSADLDYFTRQPFAPDVVRDALAARGPLSVDRMAPGTLVGTFRQTKLGCFHYPYALLKPTHDYAGVAVADLVDLACMKLDAIASRGTRRDFVDLYAICQTPLKLPQVLEAFAEKFRHVQFNRVHLLKSLVYFADAEQEPLPELLRELSWEAVRGFFAREVPRLLDRTG